MTTIDNLFDSLLEKIFKYLPRFSRLTCKEVCGRWYELLMTRAIFRNDRHIYLKNCKVKPHQAPMTVFMNAQYPYDILSVYENENNRYTLLDIFNTIDFWRRLGKSVSDINFHFEGYGFNYDCHNTEIYLIMYVMPLIKNLTIGRMLDDFPSDGIIKEISQNIDKCLPKLEKLVINFACIEKHTNFESDMAKLRAYFPERIQITIKIGDAFAKDNGIVETVLSLAKTENIKKLTFYEMNEISKETQQLFMDTEHFPSERIGFHYSYSYSLDFLKDFLLQHQYIKDVSLSVCCDQQLKLQLQSSYRKITELKIEIRKETNPIKTFKCFEVLENLKILEIVSEDYGNSEPNYHSIGHEPVNLPKLKELEIVHEKKNCEECLTALANSFPNLTKCISGPESCPTLKPFNLRLKNWKYLEHLHITFEGSENHSTNLFEDIGESRLHLRKLRLDQNSQRLKFSPEDFVKLSQICPNLNEIVIDLCEEVHNLADITKAILVGFKQLATLIIIIADITNVPKNIACEVVNHVKLHGQHLRKLHMPGKELNTKRIATELHESLSQLFIYGEKIVDDDPNDVEMSDGPIKMDE